MNYKIVNKYKINAFESKDIFLDYIEDKKKILIAMNAEKIIKSDDSLRKIVNSNIAYPDGFGAVLALKSIGLSAIKIPGSEFWLDIVSRFERSKRFYLIGSTREVIHATVNRLKREFPSIEIVGYRDGFLSDRDKYRLIDDLKKTQPDIVFVAQGSPRQEFLMQELKEEHKALYMGLGGSFDIYGGDKRRAPSLFLKLELEWFYRLLKEPTRFSRQLALIKFLIFIGKNSLLNRK